MARQERETLDSLSRVDEIPIGRNCTQCTRVWLDPVGEPDYNHCQPMLDPGLTFEGLTSSDQTAYLKKVESGGECPYFNQRS